MRYLILLILGLALAILAGNLLSFDSGLVLFSYAGYSIQMSLSVFVFLTLLVFIAVYFLVRLSWGLWRLPKNVNRWSRHRRHRRAEKLLNKGVLSELEGDWKEAENAYKRSATYSSKPMVNYLAAARAAQQQGAMERRDLYLGLAHDAESSPGLALGLTQAKLQLGQGQTEQAYATLNQLVSEQGDDRQINTLLLEVASDLGEWSQAQEILSDVRKQKSISRDSLRLRQQAIYAGQLSEAADLAELDACWNRVPGKLRDEVSIIEAFVEASIRLDRDTACEAVLRKALKKQWNDSLVRLYGLVEGSKLTKQLQFAEKLLQDQQNSAILYLSLGRLCKKLGLWGKARSYLQESIALNPTAESCQVMAFLLEEQDEADEAASYFRRGLALATQMDNEPAERMLLAAPETAGAPAAEDSA